MKKIILLTGGGDLPIEVIRKLIKGKITFFCLIFEKNPVSKMILKKNHKLINFGKIISELLRLKNLGFNHVALVGNLKRPIISDIKPDFNSVKIIPKFAKILFKGGDNNLLNFCINYLNNIGFNVVDLRKIIPENFLSSGNITKMYLPKRIIDDIKKGKLILDCISKFDIGQSLVIQSGNIIGIEAAQGTDKLIKDSFNYLNKNQKSILIKLAKLKQNLKADLPTIGVKTLKNCNKFGISGIAYSANKTLFINKQEILKYCKQNNIFLYGV